MKILVAQDDQVLADAILCSLRASGAVVDHVATGSKADTTLITHGGFDLLILGLDLPTLHGLEILRRLRARGSHLPVLVLTGADSVEERVKSLDNGADDCMAKPFSLEELKARVRALSRRGMGISGNPIRHGPLVYDQASRLSARELSLLEMLLQRAGRRSASTSWWSACANGARR
ncbi:two-component system OmpR family response regulator [Variovorax guangxiensis]|nr:two-component system OmpR family response regulator [Variovorax guangxiensis]